MGLEFEPTRVATAAPGTVWSFFSRLELLIAVWNDEDGVEYTMFTNAQGLHVRATPGTGVHITGGQWWVYTTHDT